MDIKAEGGMNGLIRGAGAATRQHHRDYSCYFLEEHRESNTNK